MYIIDGICYAGELKEGITVVAVKVLPGRILLVTLSTGEKRLFDTTTLKGSAFKVLEDDKIFSNPVLRDGVITWDNERVDIAPETVYLKSYLYDDSGRLS